MTSNSSLIIPFGEVAESIVVDTYWNGERADASKQFSASLSWNDEGLIVLFQTTADEEMAVSESPILDRKTIGLWERDVCEIFIAPDANEPRRYFEFEIAPTGEWIDLALDSTSGDRLTDWEYASGMKATATMENAAVIMEMQIPWDAFGKKPTAGDTWLGNIFRCVGKEPDRGYLAWQPTLTEIPNFHVPEKFGKLTFISTRSDSDPKSEI